MDIPFFVIEIFFLIEQIQTRKIEIYNMNELRIEFMARKEKQKIIDLFLFFKSEYKIFPFHTKQ